MMAGGSDCCKDNKLLISFFKFFVVFDYDSFRAASAVQVSFDHDDA